MKPTKLVVALVVATLGCAGPSTVYQYDSVADFKGLQTYAWTPVQMPDPGNPFVEGIFTDAADKALRARGYRVVSDSPDFIVSMYLGRVTRSEAVDSGYRAEGWQGAAHAHAFEEGTLVVDILEARTRKVIWHGEATQAMDTGASQEAMVEAHYRAVASLLQYFPPPRPMPSAGAGPLSHVRGS